MSNASFMSWIRQLCGHSTDILQQEAARYALVGLLVQEEIDHRLQQRVDESLILSGWSRSSSCAVLDNCPRTTVPGLSFHERIVQRLQQCERRDGRSIEAHTASTLMAQLKPRDQAALLLTGYQLKIPHRSEEALQASSLMDSDALPSREITLQRIWSLQRSLAGWLDIPLDPPFPSAQALQRAGILARARLMGVLEIALLDSGIFVA